MAMPSKVNVLYDQTSGADAALDTGLLDTEDYDYIGWHIVASGNITASTIAFYIGLTVAGPSIWSGASALTAGQNLFIGAWGPGCSGPAVNAAMVRAAPVPAAWRCRP